MHSPPVLYMAPVKGVTDHIFRQVYAQHFKGIKFAVTPFIDCARSNKKFENTLKPFTKKPEGMITIPQLLTNKADEFVRFSNALHDLGHQTINWNLGCPYPMAVNRGKGAALLDQPSKVIELLDISIPGIKTGLSLKVRLGLRSEKELFTLLPLLNNYPLKEIIIHGRTADQMYNGDIKINAIRKSLVLTQHIVVYNGDITTLKNFYTLQEHFNTIRHWMIGRGLLYNPFLPEGIMQINSTKNRTERLYLFHLALFKAYKEKLSGPKHVLDKMRGFWCYLAHSFGNSHEIVKKIKKCNNEKNYLECIEETFSSNLLVPE